MIFPTLAQTTGSHRFDRSAPLARARPSGSTGDAYSIRVVCDTWKPRVKCERRRRRDTWRSAWLAWRSLSGSRPSKLEQNSAISPRLVPGDWLPCWLPNCELNSGNSPVTCAPSRTRTCDPLLRRHFRAVAGQCQAWPGVLSSCTDSGRMWPGVAPCLPPLAPRLAPRNLVSPANVRMIEPSDDSRKTNFRVLWSVDTSATSGSRWSECSCRTRCRSPVPPSRWWSLSGWRSASTTRCSTCAGARGAGQGDGRSPRRSASPPGRPAARSWRPVSQVSAPAADSDAKTAIGHAPGHRRVGSPMESPLPGIQPAAANPWSRLGVPHVAVAHQPHLFRAGLTSRAASPPCRVADLRDGHYVQRLARPAGSRLESRWQACPPDDASIGVVPLRWRTCPWWRILLCPAGLSQELRTHDSGAAVPATPGHATARNAPRRPRSARPRTNHLVRHPNAGLSLVPPCLSPGCR
jgi:hypothetical protein